MSKRMSYGKIYRPDVRTRSRLPRGRILPANGFLLSTPTVKNASVQTRPLRLLGRAKKNLKII
jgi:hypothetical protein